MNGAELRYVRANTIIGLNSDFFYTGRLVLGFDILKDLLGGFSMTSLS
jgi:hypothetical protein